MSWGRRRAEDRWIDDETWVDVLSSCPMLAALTAGEDARLRELADGFLGRKSLEGAAGLEVDGAMAISIAAQACVPLLGLGLDWYDGWRSVIVYPGDFVTRHEFVDEAGVVHDGYRELAGESWDRGPIVLSWEGVQDTASGAEWGNLVIHECAHKLDMLNGTANGMPPISDPDERDRWTRVMSEAFAVLGEEAGDLDPEDILVQATEDPAEFFAVLSEWLFTDPDSLRGELEQVYGALVAFYRRDPRRSR